MFTLRTVYSVTGDSTVWEVSKRNGQDDRVIFVVVVVAVVFETGSLCVALAIPEFSL